MPVPVDDRAPCLWVLAGTNGAGKSSIGGAWIREAGGEYFDPDDVARTLLAREPSLGQRGANARAWALGLRLLDEAFLRRRDYFFETTLGGKTIAERLARAASTGYDVRIWYVGLKSADLHVARVAERVRTGGHPIPEPEIRKRYDSSRRNLIRLLPNLSELKVYDNSVEADPKRRRIPGLVLVLHWKQRKILAPKNLRKTPDWAKAIVAQAIKHVRKS